MAMQKPPKDNMAGFKKINDDTLEEDSKEGFLQTASSIWYSIFLRGISAVYWFITEIVTPIILYLALVQVTYNVMVFKSDMQVFLSILALPVLVYCLKNRGI